MGFQVDHIGIAVESLEKANEVFSLILGKTPDQEVTVESQNVRTSFFESNANIELVEATSPDSQIAKFLKKNGPGMHHLCISVDDLNGRISLLRNKGMKLIPDEPFTGAMGHKVIFIHPKSTGGVLIELAERVPSTEPSQE